MGKQGLPLLVSLLLESKGLSAVLPAQLSCRVCAGLSTPWEHSDTEKQNIVPSLVYIASEVV